MTLMEDIVTGNVELVPIFHNQLNSSTKGVPHLPVPPISAAPSPFALVRALS